ncbi:MAG: PEP-CTERM sorting domain-containing protein [Pirellulales bacterium]
MNESGQIIGNGINSLGQQHAFLLTSTVPEPSSLVLAVLGAIGVAVGCWRRRKAACVQFSVNP